MTENEIQTLYTERTDAEGVIRLERWPEGLVLWVGGEIRWKAWADPKKLVTITLSADTQEMRAIVEGLEVAVREAFS